jgi:hypothetical protein
LMVIRTVLWDVMVRPKGETPGPTSGKRLKSGTTTALTLSTLRTGMSVPEVQYPCAHRPGFKSPGGLARPRNQLFIRPVSHRSAPVLADRRALTNDQHIAPAMAVIPYSVPPHHSAPGGAGDQALDRRLQHLSPSRPPKSGYRWRWGVLCGPVQSR